MRDADAWKMRSVDPLCVIRSGQRSSESTLQVVSGTCSVIRTGHGYLLRLSVKLANTNLPLSRKEKRQDHASSGSLGQPKVGRFLTFGRFNVELRVRRRVCPLVSKSGETAARMDLNEACFPKTAQRGSKREMRRSSTKIACRALPSGRRTRWDGTNGLAVRRLKSTVT